ncbi:phenylalanyl-tRNA synthetase [Coniella lustricola]|uniref:Phenylalanine--tRNA ligase, mitochondrial n=1 Tax=Coniella lustricola TaxID=2025994 RepID=A0A2T3ABM3_9PEZI|nr:phenylalanyl-tRNA synthetase [Coniella lustricola]
MALPSFSGRHPAYHCGHTTPIVSVSTAGQVAPKPTATSTTASTINVADKVYKTDKWFNTPKNVLAAASRKLHLQQDHPICITRQIIQGVFPEPSFTYYNDLHPVVSVHENFDSLGFPADHPGRSRSDTYYINDSTLLRTHTSAHEAAIFEANKSNGFLISADVYRRDEVDRSHYPVFHQMEGARFWDRSQVAGGDIAAAVWADVEALPKHNIQVEDPNPPFHSQRNPMQTAHHSPAEAEAIAAHLKRSLELMVVEIFTRAKAAAARRDAAYKDEPLRVRWVEAYFPFTSPSWELEVYYGGDWLEVLGCGVTQQSLYINAHQPQKLGWAFGIGLDRIAMLLFNIPDIRLFWSKDARFLSQFAGVSEHLESLMPFVPFSKHPECYKDVSFWLRSSSSAGGNLAGNVHDFHENDLMEIVRSIAGDIVEDVKLIDEFTHPKTGRRSMCYRINYRSWERTLTNQETNEVHLEVQKALVQNLGVEIR